MFATRDDEKESSSIIAVSNNHSYSILHYNIVDCLVRISYTYNS